MFLIHKTDDGHVPPLEYLPSGAITPKLGLALVFSNGTLAVCSGGNKPQYICMTQRGAAVAAATPIPVVRVTPDIIFETVFSGSAAAIKAGDKVTISSDGLGLSSTTTNGVAEVVSLDGNTGGSKVRVRFD